MSRAAVLVTFTLGALAAGCPRKAEPPPPPSPEPPARDAGIDGITIIGGFDPASGMHLDDGASTPSRPSRQKQRPGKPIDIMLKSSPSGAIAAVDGVQVGVTPAYWSGEDGREHEFTFVLRGYAVSRYRFVPITSGTVHARLDPIADDPTDGGLGPLIAPVFVPDAPIAPPPTVLAPIDAAPRIVPAVPDAPPVAPAVDAPPEPPRVDAPIEPRRPDAGLAF